MATASGPIAPPLASAAHRAPGPDDAVDDKIDDQPASAPQDDTALLDPPAQELLQVQPAVVPTAHPAASAASAASAAPTTSNAHIQLTPPQQLKTSLHVLPAVKPPRIIMEHFDLATYKIDHAHGYVEADCRHCSSTIKGQKNVTSNFIQHMRRRHPQAYEQFAAASTPRAKRPRLSMKLDVVDLPNDGSPANAQQTVDVPVSNLQGTAPDQPQSHGSQPSQPVQSQDPAVQQLPPQPPAKAVKTGGGSACGKSNIRDRISAHTVVSAIAAAAAVEKHEPDMTLERALVSPTYRGAIVTPCEFAENLSARLKCHVWIKREDQQLSGTPIFRAAFNYLALTPTNRAGIIAGMPTATALALAAQRHGKSCTVCVPHFTPAGALRILKKYGANVQTAGDSEGSSCRYAQAKATIMSRTYVDLADSKLYKGYEEATSGYSTLALEILQQLPVASKVFMAAGNALMFAGVCAVLQRLGRGVKLIAVQLEDESGRASGNAAVDDAGAGADAKTDVEVGAENPVNSSGAWIAGRASAPWGNSTEEEHGPKCKGDWKVFVHDIVSVSRADTSEAVRCVYEDCGGTVLSPTGALSVAGALKYGENDDTNQERYVCVVSDPLRDFEVLCKVTRDCFKTQRTEMTYSLEHDSREATTFATLLSELVAETENKARLTRIQYTGKWPMIIGFASKDQAKHVDKLRGLGFKVEEMAESDVRTEDVDVNARMVNNVGADGNGAEAEISEQVLGYEVRLYEDEEDSVARFVAEGVKDVEVKSVWYRRSGGELASVAVRYGARGLQSADVENELSWRCHSFRRL